MLATSATGLAVTAHGVVGGGWPDVLPVLPLMLLIAVAGTALADRRRGPWTILGALVIAELSEHVLLSVTHGEHDVVTFDPWLMLAAHAVAVALTASLLARADSAILTVATAVAMLLPILWSPPRPAVVSGPRPMTAAPAGHVLDVLLRRVCARRGPPVLS
jgi:hypothetical protein